MNDQYPREAGLPGVVNLTNNRAKGFSDNPAGVLWGKMGIGWANAEGKEAPIAEGLVLRPNQDYMGAPALSILGVSGDWSGQNRHTSEGRKHERNQGLDFHRCELNARLQLVTIPKNNFSSTIPACGRSRRGSIFHLQHHAQKKARRRQQAHSARPPRAH
ncbi:MAG: hypothetical protein ABSH19_07555 [Opitutales bacterium]|jgi:hypothetical protein